MIGVSLARLLRIREVADTRAAGAGIALGRCPGEVGGPGIGGADGADGADLSRTGDGDPDGVIVWVTRGRELAYVWGRPVIE
jgi:hypothetical protein